MRSREGFVYLLHCLKNAKKTIEKSKVGESLSDGMQCNGTVYEW